MLFAKKFMLIACTLLFSSCLKEFTCECTTTTTGYGVTQTTTSQERIVKTNKENAVVECEMQNTVTYNDTTTSQSAVASQRDCRIK